MSIQDVAIAIPNYENDKIVYSSTFDEDEGDSVHTFSSSFGTGLGQYLLPLGIYSYDGGIVWHDASQYITLSGFTINPAIKGSISCNSNGQVSYSFDQTALVNGGLPYTVQMKFALLAIDTTTEVDSDFIDTGSLLYSSALSYMKIATRGEYTLTGVTVSGTDTIAHNLGYIPQFMVWIKEFSVIRPIRGLFGLSGEGEGVRADETNIYITHAGYTPAEDITFYYRIYHEN